MSLSPSIYRVLKNHAPRLHSFLGRATRRWRHANDPWAAIPRRFLGRWVWLHPQLFGEDLWSQEGHFLFPWIQRYLAPGGVFFDVGAHWGLVSLFATRTAGKVIAFEASPRHVKTLNYHRKVNGLSDVIEVAPCAVTHETTAATPFYLVDGGKSWSNSLTIGDDSTPFIRPEMKTAISAPTISLDDFSRQSGHAPDVIKIDVEGAEQWVIEGAQHTLRTCRPVLIVSIHEFWMPAKQSETTLLNLLFRLGYRIVEDHVSSGNGVQVRCCNPMKMSPCAHNRNVPSRSDSWLAPSPSRLMMASARDPSRVRKAKPYGLALDCSLADAKRALGSTRRMGLRA